MIDQGLDSIILTIDQQFKVPKSVLNLVTASTKWKINEFGLGKVNGQWLILNLGFKTQKNNDLSEFEKNLFS